MKKSHWRYIIVNNLKKYGLAFLLSALLFTTGCEASAGTAEQQKENITQTEQQSEEVSSTDAPQQDALAETDTSESISSETNSFSLTDIPEFSGSPYIVINDNNPFFTDEELSSTSFEKYSDLDPLGRCGTAYASIGKDIMPTEKREAIGHIKPSGWKTAKYDCVDGKYLFNRCHLIGFQLSAENDNEKNLITGTRYMNVDGMLPFENMVADYVKETGNHVQYRVTPVYDRENLVASGVLMEAKSVEDNGAGILFNVFCYNNQPGVEIDYADGTSRALEDTSSIVSDTKPDADKQDSSNNAAEATYILNTNTKKFHKPDCSSLSSMKEENKETFTGNRNELTQQGYEACKNCNP